jgi:hypothetical protein
VVVLGVDEGDVDAVAVQHIKKILGRFLNRLAGVVYISMVKVTGDRSESISRTDIDSHTYTLRES